MSTPSIQFDPSQVLVTVTGTTATIVCNNCLAVSIMSNAFTCAVAENLAVSSGPLVHGVVSTFAGTAPFSATFSGLTAGATYRLTLLGFYTVGSSMGSVSDVLIKQASGSFPAKPPSKNGKQKKNRKLQAKK